MNKWYFPFGKDIEPESVNNARIETFKDDIIKSLGREVCQNSIDAVAIDNKPVKVVFELKEVDINKIPDRERFKKEIIPLARATWDKDPNAQEFLDTYERILNQERVKVLRISDYNTSGLITEKWESLIEKTGISVQNNMSSGGSFGIGKAAPFASSDLRMVFYNTKTIREEEKSIGVTKFISYYRDDGTTAQGVGYLGSNRKNPILEQTSFDFVKREECGTDIFIIGFNQNKYWYKEMIPALLESFMLSIYNEKLILNVEDIEISKNTLRDLIAKLEGAKHKELKNYYSVLEDEEALKIDLDERFTKYGFAKEDGYLLLSKSEDANRSVLMTRKTGMKIYDRKRISGSIQFNGIFQATGDKFNEILRDMENPRHDDWIYTRYTDQKVAKELLKDIYNFCKENVINNYQEKIEKQVDAFGISEFLPNKIKDKSKLEDEGLEDSVNDVLLKKRNIRNITTRDILGQDLEKKLERDGIIDGEESGGGSPNDTPTSTDGGINDSGVGEKNGKNKVDSEGRKTNIKRERSFKETDKYQIRLMEINYKRGEYRLLVSGKSRTDKLKVELDLVGENGHGYRNTLLSATCDGKELLISDNSLILENPVEDNNIIDLVLPIKNRVKMEVRLYENR